MFQEFASFLYDIYDLFIYKLFTFYLLRKSYVNHNMIECIKVSTPLCVYYHSKLRLKCIFVMVDILIGWLNLFDSSDSKFCIVCLKSVGMIENENVRYSNDFSRRTNTNSEKQSLEFRNFLANNRLFAFWFVMKTTEIYSKGFPYILTSDFCKTKGSFVSM